MSADEENSPKTPSEGVSIPSPENMPAELQQLSPETRTIMTVMAGFFRSTSGPDPVAAKVLADAEMHEESCRLEAYSQSLKTRDQQNERDHAFRKKRLNHDTAKAIVVLAICIVFMICGLVILLKQGDKTLGVSLIVGGFTMLGGKNPLPKDKD